MYLPLSTGPPTNAAQKKRGCILTAIMVTAIILSLAFANPTTAQVQPNHVSPPSSPLVNSFKLPAFYRKHLAVGELPIVASAKVSDYALLEADYLIRQMTNHRPEILSAMAKNKTRFAIMAVDEMTTDVPEHRDLKPKKYWDRRARGLGATDIRPAVSCGEENLLKFPGDPYSTENILIHEFAHAMHEMGLNSIDKTFDTRLAATFESAKNNGLWKDTYAMENDREYWAEVTQSWFDTNRENDDQHNEIDTRDELKRYDPKVAKLCEEVYGDTAWRYVPPQQRRSLEHLEGYDFTASPRFEWPD